MFARPGICLVYQVQSFLSLVCLFCILQCIFPMVFKVFYYVFFIYHSYKSISMSLRPGNRAHILSKCFINIGLPLFREFSLQH